MSDNKGEIMKNLAVIAVLTVAAHICVGQFVAYQGLERFYVRKLNELDNLNQILKTSNSILGDQIRDYSQQLADLKSLPTYEDGLHAGISNSHNASYMEGYHAATRDSNPFTNTVSTYSK